MKGWMPYRYTATCHQKCPLCCNALNTSRCFHESIQNLRVPYLTCSFRRQNSRQCKFCLVGSPTRKRLLLHFTCFSSLPTPTSRTHQPQWQGMISLPRAAPYDARPLSTVQGTRMKCIEFLCPSSLPVTLGIQIEIQMSRHQSFDTNTHGTLRCEDSAEAAEKKLQKQHLFLRSNVKHA